MGDRDELPPLGQAEPDRGPFSMYRFGPMPNVLLLSPLVLLLLFTPPARLLRLLLFAGECCGGGGGGPPSPCSDVDMAAPPAPLNRDPPGEWLCSEDCELLDKFEAMAGGCRPWPARCALFSDVDIRLPAGAAR